MTEATTWNLRLDDPKARVILEHAKTLAASSIIAFSGDDGRWYVDGWTEHITRGEAEIFLTSDKPICPAPTS